MTLQANANATVLGPDGVNDVILIGGAQVGPTDLRAADGDKGGPAKFEMVAYSGGPMDFGTTWYVDLAGLAIGAKSRPIVDHHSTWSFGSVIGHTTDVAISGGQLLVKGLLSGTGESAQAVRSLAANGFPFQASIGARIRRVERVEAGAAAEVNGRTVQGPCTIVRASELKEISFVVLGADDATSARLAASASRRSDHMPTENTTLPAVPATVAASSPQGVTAPSAAPANDPVAELRAKFADEANRVAAIHAACGDRKDLAAAAIKDGSTVEQVRVRLLEAELQELRAGRPAAPAIHAHAGVEMNSQVLEASLRLAGKVGDVEKDYRPETLDAAQKAFPNGISLGEFLNACAIRNGYRGPGVRQDPRGVLRAGFSTREISSILGNVVNKALAMGFAAPEQAWRAIARVRSLVDFKPHTVHRLTGDYELKRLNASGELEMASLSNESYSLQADTYGRLVAVTRKDIINDDLGCLTDLPQRLGRGAAIAVNKVFWAEFGNNASFFSSGNANLLTGAGSALGVAGLKAAEAAFGSLKDDQGNPLSGRAAILLVPLQLSFDARQLYVSQEVRDTTASKVAPTANVFQNLYRPVSSWYVGDSAYGGSATNWYLLGDPADMPVMQIGFLNGKESPVVEEVEMESDMLGFALRGYFDFGAGKAEYRGGVKNAGA